MPYCSQCGRTVTSADVYCSNCGGRQPVTTPPPNPDFMSSISPRTASLLCYIPVLGWIAAIVVLASNSFRNNPKVRFNAFQGLYLFVAWLIVDWVISPIFHVPTFFGTPHFYRVFPALMKALIFGAWIFMIIKASQDEVFKLPILGELAEKSVTEQR
jgi:uncharacterized membrane protein